MTHHPDHQLGVCCPCPSCSARTRRERARWEAILLQRIDVLQRYYLEPCRKYRKIARYDFYHPELFRPPNRLSERLAIQLERAIFAPIEHQMQTCEGDFGDAEKVVEAWRLGLERRCAAIRRRVGRGYTTAYVREAYRYDSDWNNPIASWQGLAAWAGLPYEECDRKCGLPEGTWLYDYMAYGGTRSRKKFMAAYHTLIGETPP